MLISARDLSLSTGGTDILRHVDFTISAGEIVTLIGPNGSGKTSLLKALLGLVPVKGTIMRKPGLAIGYVPQNFPRDRSLPITVERFLKLFGGDGDALARTGSGHLRMRQLAALSGGELARVLLARAIASKPELLILDEPLSGVDIAGEAALYHLIAELRDEIGCGVLLVSHDLHVVMAQADRVICLNGHVCCEGAAEHVMKDPAFAELFGPRVAGEPLSTPIITIMSMGTNMGTSTDMDDFLIRAGVGAGLLGAAAGPIGCFVLWRRMAYLGESIAHMGLLGAAIGLLMGVAPLAGVGALAVAAALLMARARDDLIPAGTFVGIVGHVGLALGFVLLATMDTVRTDLLGYLFGDVLALSNGDLLEIAGAALAVLVASIFFWRFWLMAAVNGDIARAEGRANRFADLAFLILVALLVAFGLRVIGALLVVALIIIPPAAARPFAKTPETMAVLAALVGAAAAPLGLALAWWKDIPAGPAIVLAAASMFALSTLAARLRR